MDDIQDLEIERIEVIGFQKRGQDNVFIVNVVYSNDWEIEVCRRFSDFVALHRALLRFSHHNSSHLPSLPAFNELFESVFSDEEGSCFQPSLELLDNYFSGLCDIDCQLVNQFFESDEYDMKLSEKDVRNKIDCDDVIQTCLPQSLVLMDFYSKQGSFAVRAGDTVSQIGIDKKDFALVGHKNTGRMQFGWIPSVYLLEIEGKDDPLVKDLVEYFKEMQGNDEHVEDPFSRPSSVASNSSVYSTSSCGSASDVGYYQYSLTDDCYLSCSFGDDVLVSVGDKVVVIDKDTDGWWYVTTVNGIEGWLPSTILEPRRVSLRKGNKELDKVYQPADVFTERHLPCYVSKPYKAKRKDELTVKAGELVHLVCESPSGWWTVQHNRSLGLVPGLFLTKQTSTKMSQPLKKAFAVGFNCSFLTEPPPRRDTFSRCASPISPPSIMDYDVSMYTYKIKQNGRRAWTPSNLSTSESEYSRVSSSPQTTDDPPVIDNDTIYTVDDVFRDEDDHLVHHQSPLPDSTPVPPTNPSSHAYSSPLTSVTIGSRESQSPLLVEVKSPIPDRFLSGSRPHLGVLGKSYNTRGSVSPIPERTSRSPIPDRFISNNSLTPKVSRPSRCSLPVLYQRSDLHLVDGRSSSDDMFGNSRRHLVKIAPIDDDPSTDDDEVINDDVINDDVINDDVTGKSLVNGSVKCSLVRTPNVQSYIDIDPDLTPKVSPRVPVYLAISDDELFVDDDRVIQRHNSISCDDRDLINNSDDHIQSNHRQSLITSSLPSMLPPRAASAPPTTKLKRDNKKEKKVSLRKKDLRTKHGFFIPQMETGL